MRTLKKTVCAILIVLTLFQSAAFAERLEAVFLDVGMADCALFVCDGEAMMIDTGAASANWEHIRQTMSALGIDALRYLVLTHPHFDHTGNAARAIEQFDVGHVLMPSVEYDTQMYGSIIAAIDDKRLDKIYPQVGEMFTLGSAEVIVYGPHPVAYRNENNWSVVLMVRYAGRSVLMTGDIEAEAERDLLSFDDEFPLAADVLKVAHHGSATSSTFDFIEAVSPTYAVVSCSSSASREYPHVETAMTLYDCGVQDVLTTEKLGDIYLSIGESGALSIGAADRLEDAA